MVIPDSFKEKYYVKFGKIVMISREIDNISINQKEDEIIVTAMLSSNIVKLDEMRNNLIKCTETLIQKTNSVMPILLHLNS